MYQGDSKDSKFDCNVVLKLGTLVRVVQIDHHGLQGREHHPRVEDEGVYEGVVYCVHVWEEETNEQLVLGEGDTCPDNAFITYDVIDTAGRKLEVAGYELCPVDMLGMEGTVTRC